MKRNLGIDLLRILSMFMVVILHILGHGGILSATVPNSLNYWGAWLLEVACYCAVNCFALISGYVMCHSSAKISRAFGLWLQTFFYTALAVLFFLIFKPEAVGLKSLVNALLPITRKHYWYISAYFGLLALSPLLNAAIAHMEKKVLGGTLLIAWSLFSFLPHVLLADPYGFKNGYNLMWLVLLYLAGGYINKYDISDKVKKSQASLLVGVMIFLTFLSKFVLETLSVPFLPTKGLGNSFITYTSPTIVLVAVGLLILCSKQTFGKLGASLIGILSPASLGVYLIHSNQLVWDYLLKDVFERFASYSCIVMVCLVLLSALGIYTLCTIIELGRIKLFKLAKVHKLCNAAEAWLLRFFDSYIKI